MTSKDPKQNKHTVNDTKAHHNQIAKSVIKSTQMTEKNTS